MSGWTMRARKRCRADISTVVVTGCASASWFVRPSKRVIVRPSSWASSPSREVAVRSHSRPSSASRSVNAFASVMAVSASATLRAATPGVAPQIGGGIVEDLLLHRLVDADWIATDRQQGRGGTCVGARRHGRDVRSEQDEETGGRGACASRRNVHSHGRARIDDVLDDLAHRCVEAAGCVDRDEDQRRAAVVGLVDAARRRTRPSRGRPRRRCAAPRRAPTWRRSRSAGARRPPPAQQPGEAANTSRAVASRSV